MYYLAAVVAAVVLCVSSGAQAENVTMQEMPLSYFKASGMAEAYQNNDNKMIVDMFMGEYETELGEDGKMDEEMILRMRSDVDVIGDNQVTCQPHPLIYELPNDRPNVKLYPSCILLNQCPDCNNCGHLMLKCKPNVTRTTQVKVIEFVYDGIKAESKATYIDVVEHTTCACSCKIEESDCNTTMHIYDPFDCKCSCKETQQCASNKRWDEDTCSCQCALPTPCGEGYFFNTSTCQCEVYKAVKSVNVKVTPLMAVETKPVCPDLKCPRRYVPQMSNSGMCYCEFPGK